jgi:nucleoid-associated protein YgaU
MELTKIRFEVFGKSLTAKPVSSFVAHFNPTEYTLVKATQIAEIGIPGLDTPVLQYIRGQNERLTFDLLFDTAEQGMGTDATPVTELTKDVYQLVKIQRDTHAAPRFRVSWGKGISFVAIAEQVQQKFTLFSPEGIPLRATVSLTLREYKTLDGQLAELKLQSSDHTKVRTVVSGQTLEDIAAAEYGDPRAWRAIADHNRVADPRRPEPGTTLVIPPLDNGGGPP